MDIIDFGAKEINYDSKGNITVIDTRNFAKYQEAILSNLQKSYNEQILEEVPLHKQSNMALGLVPEEEKAALLNIIQTYRQSYEVKKNAILACKTCDEIDEIINRELK